MHNSSQMQLFSMLRCSTPGARAVAFGGWVVSMALVRACIAAYGGIPHGSDCDDGKVERDHVSVADAALPFVSLGLSQAQTRTQLV